MYAQECAPGSNYRNHRSFPPEGGFFFEITCPRGKLKYQGEKVLSLLDAVTPGGN